MKKIICLYGGPGCGKSTTCAHLFALLKQKGLDCEMNREYIKDWVWEGRELIPGDQVYLFAKQSRKERTYILKNLDYIITDSPLILNHYYGLKFDKYEQKFHTCKELLKQHHQFCIDNDYKVEHFVLNRSKDYNPNGRFQTESEAKELDSEITSLLDEMNIKYHKINGDSEAANSILKILGE